MDDNGPVRVDQTLHGYSDGHRLLANSLDLSRGAKHVLLELSDMSGRSMVRGFEEYLTGYPLADAKLYAFARTWYAPELERPGCVWTHTLLLDVAALSSFEALSSLSAYFRRPTAGTDATSTYGVPLEVLPTALGPKLLLPGGTKVAAAVLAALYGSAADPVFLPASRAQPYEALVLAIWQQQWPALRATFRFCTGAISPRMLAGTPFDLQVIPETSLREARRVPRAAIVEPSSAGTTTPLWTSGAVSDLYQQTDLGLRRFLASCSKAAAPDRGLFGLLAELWATAGTGDVSPHHVLDTIAERYPDPSEGRSLKQALLSGPSAVLKTLCPGSSWADVLQYLATTAGGRAFDPDDLPLDQASTGLWHEERGAALALTENLIRRADASPLGEKLLSSLVRTVNVEDALELFNRAPPLGASLVQGNPLIAGDPRVWKGSADQQRELFAAATTTPLLRDQWTSIIVAMLGAGSDVVADQVIAKWGSEAALSVLSWFDSSKLVSPRDLGEEWHRALAGRGPVLLDWLASAAAPREVSASLIADLLDPHDRRVHSHGAQLWLRTYRDVEASTPKWASLRLRAFELALGLDNPGPQSDVLVVKSFGPIHRAAADEELDYSSWMWLEGNTPTLAWWKSWDKCERLRRGLIAGFINHAWPIEKFLGCAPDEETLGQLLESCRHTKKGAVMLRQLADAIAARVVSPSEASLRILRRYV